MKIDKTKARHDLTRLLKLDMYEVKNAEEPELISFYSGRMYGMVAAYWQMGMIDMCARVRYINLISANVIKQHKRLLYE